MPVNITGPTEFVLSISCPSGVTPPTQYEVFAGCMDSGAPIVPGYTNTYDNPCAAAQGLNPSAPVTATVSNGTVSFPFDLTKVLAQGSEDDVNVTSVAMDGSGNFLAATARNCPPNNDCDIPVTIGAPDATATPTPTPTPTATPCTGRGCPTPTPNKCGGRGLPPCSTPTPTATATATPTATPTTSGTPVPGSAADFLNHTSVDDQFVASGETGAQQLSMMEYLGVKHVRSDFMCGDPQGCTGLGDPIGTVMVPNAHAGGYTYITQPNCGPDGSNLNSGSISFDIYVDQAFGDTLYALGACNEPNNQPYYWNGTGCFEGGTAAGCIAEQEAFYVAAKAAFPNIPVYSQPEAGGAEPDNVGLQFLTNSGTIQADYADLHNYADRGNNTWVPGMTASVFENNGLGDNYDGMSGEYCGSTFGQGFPATSPANCPTVPRVTTETGWSYQDGGLTEDQRGKVLTDLYVMGYMKGEGVVSLYVLYNGSGWELFYDSNGPDTPTATIPAEYIHNLTTILADPVVSFVPTTPTVTLTGATDPTDHWMVLAKSNGKHDLVFVPDRPTGSDVETITVNQAGNIYDITQGTTPVATGSTFTANDHIMILEF